MSFKNSVLYKLGRYSGMPKNVIRGLAKEDSNDESLDVYLSKNSRSKINVALTMMNKNKIQKDVQDRFKELIDSGYNVVEYVVQEGESLALKEPINIIGSIDHDKKEIVLFELDRSPRGMQAVEHKDIEDFIRRALLWNQMILSGDYVEVNNEIMPIKQLISRLKGDLDEDSKSVVSGDKTE